MKRRRFLTGAAALAAGLAYGPAAVGQGADKRLALKGYDPVAYFTESRAALGNPEFEHAWDGAVYRFVSARHLALFKADPDRYLPQYGNLCTASLANGRKRTPDPKLWLVHEGRLYLFGAQAGQAAMSANPAAFRAQADANWAKLVSPAAGHVR